MPTNKLIIVALAMVALFGASVSALAVMSIDLGSEWMKVGIVSPGVPMEIVLNKESKRKTPAILSFRDGIRSFGEDAQTVGIRFPKNSYAYLLDLLGKNINNPMVKLFKQRFPYYDIVEDPVRGTVLFQHDENTLYSPEELIAQILSKAKEMAEVSAGQKIKDCVLTIPGFFNQAERKSILQAAQLADLKILQLYNDYMAVALNYGIFRRKDFNETAQYVMFYDMGASKTTATVVSYQLVKTKERGFLETNPQATVIGVGYDRTLGGLEVQLRLRDYLAKKFNELKVTSNDVFKNPRAMAKLFKEAGRVKNVLSANTDHYAQIEGLLDDKDFRVQVTRENLEELCKDLFDRVGEPVKQALDMAGLPIDVINQVVLVGAGTRVPKVQEELQKIVNMELSKNINADEAATMGAVYKAADLSAGFQVKKFITKDGVLFPIQVVFERTSDNGGSKLVKRTLFGLMNPYPQKKIITFNKHTNDFSFTVNYAELDHLPQSEIAVLGGLNLTEVNLSGISDILEKKKTENVDSKGIKAHFFLDESGVLNLVNAEFVFEKTVQPGELEEEGTFSKLGSTISKLFSGSSDDTVAKEKPVHEEPEPTATESPKENATDSKKVNDTEKETNATKKEEKDAGKEVKPKVVVIRETIQTSNKTLTLQLLNDDQIKDSRKKLKNLDTVDKKRARRESALNNLESFVIDAQNKLYNDEYVEAGSESEIEKIKTACSEVSDWLYDEGSDADADTYDKKLGELQSLTMDLFNRVFEHRERPEALNVLKDHINKSQSFLASAKNFTKGSENDIFTDVEIENLQKVITETIEWRDKLVEEQSKLKKSEPVKLTVYMISEKLQLLDREVKYLVNKMKIWRPKVVKEKSTETKTEQKTSEEKSESQEKAPETNDEDSSKSPNIPEQSSEDSSETNQEEKPEEEIPDPTPTVQDSDDDHSEL